MSGNNAFFEWLLNLPVYFAQFGKWLNDPIVVKGWNGDTLAYFPSPMVLFGTGLVAFVGAILVLRLFHLISPLG